MTKGEYGRWRLEIRLFRKYLYLSNTPMKFKCRQNELKGAARMKNIKVFILSRRGNRCEHCGRSAADGHYLELHHIQPVSERPDLVHDPTNILLLCRECHLQLHQEIDHARMEAAKLQ